jgi:hypothetical protein
LGCGVVQGRKAELVTDNQIVAVQGVDASADGVVGQASVKGVDQLGGSQVTHSVAGVDRGRAKAAM